MDADTEILIRQLCEDEFANCHCDNEYQSGKNYIISQVLAILDEDE